MPGEPYSKTTLADTLTAQGAGTKNSAAVEVKHGRTIGVVLDVTDSTGTGETLDIEIEWSGNGIRFGSAEGTADTFNQIVAGAVPIVVAKRFTAKGPFFRIVSVIAGTAPTFTGTVTVKEA